MNPFWFILLVSFAVALITTLVYKYTSNQEAIKKAKAELLFMKMDSEDKWKRQAILMRSSTVSALCTIVPSIILFRWLMLNMSRDPIIDISFIHIGWLGSYMIFTMVCTMIIRKLLKVY